MTLRLHPSMSGQRRGFTLVELAIVLVVAGILFAGLWRLIAGGNSALSASSAAAQQVQIINAVKGYLASANGQSWMGSQPAGSTTTIALPNTAGDAPNGTDNGLCKGSMPGGASGMQAGICDYLPAGFLQSTFTNPYGQTYSAAVIKDNTAAPGPPHSYSFMVVTAGGNTIPDSQGGSISSQIGGDGGFVYNSNLCGTPYVTTACGAYGAWTASIATYGYGDSHGHIASRTYVSPAADANLPWLARQLIPGDTAATASPNTNTYNTMTTPMALETVAPVPPAATPTLFMNGGQILGSGTSNLHINGTMSYTTAGSQPVSAMVVTSGCVQTNPNTQAAAGGFCQDALQVTGDVTISDLLIAGAIYSPNFIYDTSATSSDIRLKRDIRPIHHALDDLAKIPAVSYVLKSSGEASIGVLAQDVEKVYPQLVTTPAATGYKAVNYNGLIGPLIESVQELKQENEELRRQLNAQEKRQQKLEAELHAGRGND